MKRANRLLYGLHYLARHARPWAVTRGFWSHRSAPARAARPGSPALYLAFGRIGDMVLSSGATRNLRRWLGRPVVMVGREEVRELAAPHVDRFVPFSTSHWVADAAYRQRFAAGIRGEYEIVLGDLHLFHGGGFYFADLIDATPAKHKVLYAGYGRRADLAPLRRWPRTATRIASAPVASGDVTARHVWHDLVHYMREALTLCTGAPPADLASELRPQLDLPRGNAAAVLERCGLRRGDYVVCQPISGNRKKDLPAVVWREVFAAFPSHTFALLGTAAEARRCRELVAPNTVNLCGHTTLRESIQIIEAAAAFVGVDSGLTHVAACLGLDTVCAAQSANLGYFFPYPAQLGFDRVRVVHNEDYAECAGCLMVCRREPIWNTYRQGSLCLRTLPSARVIDALAAVLRSEISARDPVSCP